MSSAIPAAVMGANIAAPSGSVRQVECHVGVPTPAPTAKPGGGGTPAPSGGDTFDLCKGYAGVIDGFSDNDLIVSAVSANTKVVTVAPDPARNKAMPTANGHPASWFDVAAVGVGTAVVTLRDASGHTGTVTVVVKDCGPGPTPAPTATP